MSTPDPISLLFSGMEKLGPGGNTHTLHVLGLLPTRSFQVVVDAGCGTGRQTLALATELGVLVHAVDTYEPFLSELTRRAREARVDSLVQTHCMDMESVPNAFPAIDLLWSEGAAYNIGYANALSTWASAVVPQGFAVVSELCWLTPQAPAAITEYFRVGYPEMKSVQENLAIAEAAGFRVLATYTLPREAWIEGYYDILESRAKALVDHSDQSVRDLATETLREIEIFDRSDGAYGYVFFALQRV